MSLDFKMRDFGKCTKIKKASTRSKKKSSLQTNTPHLFRFQINTFTFYHFLKITQDLSSFTFTSAVDFSNQELVLLTLLKAVHPLLTITITCLQTPKSGAVYPTFVHYLLLSLRSNAHFLSDTIKITHVSLTLRPL